MRRKNMVISVMLLLTPIIIYAENYSPLKIVTEETREALVRHKLVSAFEDVINAPTLINTEGYIEIALMENAYITKEYCHVAIHVKSENGKTRISAYPFIYEGNKKIAIANKPLYLGIRILIEGAAEELDYRKRRAINLAGL